jgi:hypothetical protein
LPVYAYSNGGDQATAQHAAYSAIPEEFPRLRPRPLNLRAITGRIRGGDS